MPLLPLRGQGGHLDLLRAGPGHLDLLLAGPDYLDLFWGVRLAVSLVM